MRHVVTLLLVVPLCQKRRKNNRRVTVAVWGKISVYVKTNQILSSNQITSFKHVVSLPFPLFLACSHRVRVSHKISWSIWMFVCSRHYRIEFHQSKRKYGLFATYFMLIVSFSYSFPYVFGLRTTTDQHLIMKQRSCDRFLMSSTSLSINECKYKQKCKEEKGRPLDRSISICYLIICVFYYVWLICFQFSIMQHDTCLCKLELKR